MNSIPQTGRSARYVDPPTLPGIPVSRGHRHDDLYPTALGRHGPDSGTDTDAFPAVPPGGTSGRADPLTAAFPAPGRDLDPPTAELFVARREADPPTDLGAAFDRPDFDGADFEDRDVDGADFDDPDFDDRDFDRADFDDAGVDRGFDRDDRDSAGPGRGDGEGRGPTGVLIPVAATHRRRGRRAALLLPVAAGIAVSVGLGVYARLHEGTGVALNIAGFSSGIAAKTWLTAAAFAFGLVQLGTAVVLSGRIGRGAGRGTHLLHRWSGRIAVLLTIPVAVHCLYALGFSDASPRVLAHSLLGCFFYGAFTTKMLLVSRREAPAWALPVFGGAVFTLLTGVFLTSSVWFFRTTGFVF